MLDRSPQRSVSTFRDLAGGDSVNMVVIGITQSQNPKRRMAHQLASIPQFGLVSSRTFPAPTKRNKPCKRIARRNTPQPIIAMCILMAKPAIQKFAFVRVKDTCFVTKHVENVPPYLRSNSILLLVKDLLRQRPLLTQPFRKCHKSPDNKAVNRSRRSPSSQIRVSWRRLGYRWRYPAEARLW